MWKRSRQRAEFEKLMALLEARTAEMIVAYVAGKWDSVLGVARELEESLKPIATVPRMEICLYHVESIQLRIALQRADVDLIRDVARKCNNLEVSERAFNALQKVEIGRGVLERVCHELERELKTVSNAEGQIMRMTNPDPRLIGTKFFPNLYIPG